MGDVVHLFNRTAPTMTSDESEFWAWGQDNADDWVNNADLIVEEIKGAGNEFALLRALQELKDEIEKIPGLE